jgi:hypothetical protein
MVMVEVILMVFIMAENELVSNKKLTCYCRNYCLCGHDSHDDLPVIDLFSIRCTDRNNIIY